MENKSIGYTRLHVSSANFPVLRAARHEVSMFVHRYLVDGCVVLGKIQYKKPLPTSLSLYKLST